ncbi:hypothetical protein JO40_09700 [Treponema putidum]|nr:hypothetical protein JO40_09700 [Treponema putidum]
MPKISLLFFQKSIENLCFFIIFIKKLILKQMTSRLAKDRRNRFQCRKSLIRCDNTIKKKHFQ